MAKFTVDATHSTIGFEVKHMMGSKAKGQFNEYTAEAGAADLTELTAVQISFN